MILADLKSGLRLLLKHPGASLLAMIALGLGIGANTAIFSIANGLLLHPLPYANMSRLLYVGERSPHQTNPYPQSSSPYDFLTWQRQARSFSALAAWRYRQMNLSGAGTPVLAMGAAVSGDFFRVMPAGLLRGRAFVPEEMQPGHEREVILSQELWNNQFAANPAIIGQTVELNQEAYTVIGILNQQAVMPQAAEFWIPLAFTPQEADNRAAHYLQVVGELRPGVKAAAALAELQAVAARIDAAYPATNRGWGVLEMPLAERVIGNQTSGYIFLLLGATGFLLLIACANVANLQFARTLRRNHELAIRTALGAGRLRLLRQMLTENVVLALGGALVGAAFAAISLRLIVDNMPAEVAVFIGGWDHVRLDGAALGFTLIIALLAAVLAGLAPAWHASRPDCNATLKEGGRGAVGQSRRRVRAALVVLQVALAVVLLVGAGLMVKGFNAQLNVGQVYKPATLLTAGVNLPPQQYKTDAARAAFYDQAMARLGALPGTRAALVSAFLPLSGNLDYNTFSIEGRPVYNASQARYAVPQAISPNFFATMHVPVLQGRAFTASDGSGAPGVAIISQRLAQRYFHGESALGQHIKYGRDDAAEPWVTIVGVAGDVTWQWGDNAPEPTIYRPVDQAPQASEYLLLRGRGKGDVTQGGAAARRAVMGIDAHLPLSQVMSLAEAIHQASIGIAYVAVMLTVAAVLALVLAAIGVYGIMAFLVSERVHEFGIRRALGASDGAILGLVMGRAGVMLAWGFALGLPLAYALARGLQSLILTPGVSAADPATYAGICLLLLVMGGLACYLPARQAAKVDPLVALREP